MVPANIYSRLESNLTKWQKLLMDIKLEIYAVGKPYSCLSLYAVYCAICHCFPFFVSCWCACLCSLISRKSRNTVDTTETMKQFGPVEIHYGKVQQKVNLKHDSWHRELLSSFVGEDLQDFYSTVVKASLLILSLSCCMYILWWGTIQWQRPNLSLYTECIYSYISFLLGLCLKSKMSETSGKIIPVNERG